MACKATVAAWISALLLATSVHATYWTVTSYYILSESTSSVYTDFTLTYTNTLTVQLGATPTLSAVSSSQLVESYYELTIIYVYLPEHAVPDSEVLTTETTSTGYRYTQWIEPTVLTAPASCPTPFTLETTTYLDIPSQVEYMYTPTSVTSIVDASTITWVTAYLRTNEVALPPDTTGYIFTEYLNSCINPTADDAAATKTGSSSSSSSGVYNGGDDGGDDDFTVCSLATGCTSYRTWVIVVATIIPVIFVLGFVESYLWFRRLMLGKGTLRFGTVCWVLISLWVLCFTRIQSERSPEAQALMRQRWNITGGGRRFSLWWKWGFRHAYPVEMLGDPRMDVAAGAFKVEGQQAGQWQQPQGQGAPPAPMFYQAPVQQGTQNEQPLQPDQGYQPDLVNHPEQANHPSQVHQPDDANQHAPGNRDAGD